MRVIQVVKTLAEEYGGPARTVQGLVAGLNACGVEAWLVSLEDGGAPWVEGINHYRCFALRGVKGVEKKMENLIDEIHPDIVQTNDIWMPKMHACAVAARRKGVPYIITPHGTLEVWSLRQKWWKKYPALWTYQGYDMRHALAIHSTADSEIKQVKKFCGKTPVYYNTNGVIFPRELPERCVHADGFHRAVFVSRIHKKKGLMNLIHAWAQIRPSGWKMEIVGTDADGYQKQVEDEVRRCGLQDDFIFTGPLSDTEKWKAYMRSDLFILPTNSENFGIVVAEALYAGVPVITTKGAPWKCIEETKSGWWIDIGVEPLVDALRKAFSLTDDERREMGVRGNLLVLDRFSWNKIAKELKEIYEKLLMRA